MELKQKRIEYIDALKGIAINCVVLGHILNGYINSSLWPYINDNLHDVYNVIYAFHMPLFFSISGYVYSLVYFDKDRDLKRKKIKSHLIDYVWIYILFSILMWGFKLLAADGVNKPISSYAILMIWAKPIAIYWYLYVLVVYYIIFIPLIKKTIDVRIVFAILSLVCISSVFVSVRIPFQLYHILYFAIFFWLGICKQNNPSFVLMRKCGVAIVFFVAVVLMILCWDCGTDFNRIPFANLIIALGITCAFWYVFENIRGGGVLSLCGKYCLEIYLMHVFVGSGMRIFGLGINLMRDMPILCIIINVLLSVSFPIILSLILRKIKIYELLFKPYEFFTK